MTGKAVQEREKGVGEERERRKRCVRMAKVIGSRNPRWRVPYASIRRSGRV